MRTTSNEHKQAGERDAAPSRPIATQPVMLWPSASVETAGVEVDDLPRLTPFILPNSEPAAAVIVCPGGAYAKRGTHEGEPVARWLNSIGIAAFVLDYRVGPNRHPAPLSDAQRAIRLVRHQAERWNIRADRVGILGFSAGGHLSATAATTWDRGDRHSADPIDQHSNRPDLLVLCYPVISFGSCTHAGSMRNLLGPDPSSDLRRSLSAELSVTADTPPTFLWHTADDPGVPAEHSLLFAAALHRYGVPYALHIYPHGPHGLGLAAEHPDVRSWTMHCARFLARHGFIDPSIDRSA